MPCSKTLATEAEIFQTRRNYNLIGSFFLITPGKWKQFLHSVPPYFPRHTVKVSYSATANPQSVSLASQAPGCWIKLSTHPSTHSASATGFSESSPSHRRTELTPFLLTVSWLGSLSLYYNEFCLLCLFSLYSLPTPTLCPKFMQVAASIHE